MRTRPDILVLGGGGVLGEAWISGVLGGISAAHGIDLRRVEYFIGTSAGAIVCARLSAGIEPRSPGHPVALGDPSESVAGKRLDAPHSHGSGTAVRALIETGAGIAQTLAFPWVRLGLAVGAPAGALARAAALRVLPTGAETHAELRRTIDTYHARFDGRLRIAAVQRSTGRRVVFGSPGAPHATVTDAVEASCTIPAIYAPVRIGTSDYVDGGIWSPTNLDAAPARRGANVLCLSPTASLHGPLALAIRGPSRTITLLEITALRSRGAEVELITPDRDSAAAIGLDPMARTPAASVLTAGYRQGLSL